MDSYICQICGHEYDPKVGEPSLGIKPGTAFADLPADFKCPICLAEKGQFKLDISPSALFADRTAQKT